MLSYLIGIAGMWLFCDAIISIRLYYGTQSWLKDHSIRILRLMIALFLMIAAAVQIA